MSLVRHRVLTRSPDSPRMPLMAARSISHWRAFCSGVDSPHLNRRREWDTGLPGTHSTRRCRKCLANRAKYAEVPSPLMGEGANAFILY